MIDRHEAMPFSHQAKLLDLPRSGLYYQPVPISAADLEFMREIDRLHTDYPFAGARRKERTCECCDDEEASYHSISEMTRPMRFAEDGFSIGRPTSLLTLTGAFESGANNIRCLSNSRSDCGARLERGRALRRSYYVFEADCPASTVFVTLAP